ncbi:site-2 protease family protein [Candidatus Beckwithbacteria bacterium CG10_big_fil_rev_8_21_14_0_10_34_10]|uniref:Site-2 protease family protein n=1 Tax=Candidatus Beckwithbacteria bacterium CG10_big_fil_rev_8_21_14_0_10_34_10 TaxID=1974495 RepID=A0A2H0W8P3_9BACT|nr:MAG: site-2 protease family protein [Candidatus Beckwithbacteria bacterium CG10_big_fil_rev_8_21_14_0_10_34_10]
MLDLLINNPLVFLIWLISILAAVSIHEFAHSFMADKLGDPTPRLAGRLTLNPIAHLDPLGTLALIVAQVGWGKPVPVDPYNFRNPKRDSALVSLAGPLSNFILAGLISLIIKFLPLTLNPLLIFSFIYPFLAINIGLGVFNLIPIPPLDGSKVLTGLLPTNLALKVEETMAEYGLILLIAILLPIFNGTSLASIVIFPIIQTILGLLL